MAFNTLTLNELAHALSSRSKYRNVFGDQSLPPNRHLTRAILGMGGLQAVVSLVPALRRLLGTTPLGLADLLVIGAALSGKDPWRIDRVGAYAARYAAKNIVAAGLAERCEVQLSYSVGMAGPVSVRVRTYGTGKVNDKELARRVAKVFDFRLGAIVRDMRLRDLPAETKGGFYRKLAAYGHMGRTDLDAPWERTDRAEALK